MIFMKKIERWSRSCLAFGSRHKLLLVVILSLLFLGFGIFYGLVYGRLWLRLPAQMRAEIALNRLGVSAYNDPICHESCFYERHLYKQIIASSWSNKKINKQVSDLILAEDNNLDFRLELLDTLSFQTNLEIPDYLNNYLVSGAEIRVKEKINDLFGLNNNLVDELLNQFNNSVSVEDQINILRDLQEKSDSSLAGFYLDLIKGEFDLKIKNGALSALSNLLPSKTYVTNDFLVQIEKLILNANTNKYLRKGLVSLLGSYLSIQEKLVTEILFKIYSDTKTVDKFSQLFAADILNRLSANSYVKPEISASEWQEYRDHNSLWGND